MDLQSLEILVVLVTCAGGGYLLLKYNYFLSSSRRESLPTYWPVVGMLPNLLVNRHKFHDWCLNIFKQSNGTFYIQGPWFMSSLNLLLTGDPANIHHIMSKNFPNFPKGEMFAEIFEILGDGIFNSDSELWQYQRRVAHSFLTHPGFHRMLTRTVRRKVELGLLPILDSAWRDGRVIDAEDLFQRFNFDIICTLITGTDTNCLSPDFPDLPFAKALDDAQEVMFHRHLIPESVWKLQRWLGIGRERKMTEAWKILDNFIYDCLALKKQELQAAGKNLYSGLETDDQLGGVDLLTTLYMEQNRCCSDNGNRDNKFSDKFLRDMFLNLLLAGRDTSSAALTWFFWILFKNPEIKSKIQEEIRSVLQNHEEEELKTTENTNFLKPEQISKLVYLHGALCETLRLYPPVPTEHKSPLESEMLPSGQRVDPTMKILINLYAMGRMESIWGKDCNEVKPERWISERGSIKHEPSYKFLAFNAGPRTCLGKDMAFTVLKILVSTLLMRGYHLEVVNEDEVDYQVSILLHTKTGLKVKVCKEEQIV